jgi:glutamate-5-semialdehyde dehydrogenase (EC 1.2.1.41)
MGLAREIAEKAKKAQPQIARASSDKKNKILQKIAEYLEENIESILSANQKDLSNAEKNGANKALLDRLKLDEKRVKALIKSVEEIIKLPDPVGQIIEMKPRPNGLLVGRMRIPLGVIATIYEARPGVTVDIASLCIKSGNAVILRGGSEALETNSVLVQLIKKAIKDEGIDENIVGFINDPSREHIFELLKLEELIDLVIPRGGEGLIRFVAENSRVPVLKHYKGVCHIFVDEFADLEKAYRVCLNAKVQRPSVCNAMETLLVHEKIAEKFLPTMGKIFREHGVELRGCEKTRKIIPYAIPATEDDWYAEYLDLILAVKSCIIN